MTISKENLNVLDVFKFISRCNKALHNSYTIIITGRTGPTGKTWLCNELIKAGYKAIELTPLKFHNLIEDDGKNHVIYDDNAKQVVVVLNEILPMYANKWGKVSDSDSDDTFAHIFSTRDEAESFLDRISEIVSMYGVVTMGDLLELIDKPTNYKDHHYGWLENAICRAEVMRVRSGYIIKLPRATHIRF